MDIPSEVQEFYEIARAYCTWAEGAPEESDEKAYQAMKYLASLYKQALILPSADPEDDQLEVEGITKLDSKRIYIRFSSLPFQYYHDAFHPVAQEPEKPTVGDLADDLMDIYIDLKEGVLLYEIGKPTNAVFQWRTTFGFHWGRHAVSALKAMHCYESDADKSNKL